ncbi:MAG: hypothetical protein ABI865_09020 [Nitrosospira sp.]
MKLDRELQLKILLTLRDIYPDFGEISVWFNHDDPNVQGNLFYLAEHNFIEPSAVRQAMGVPRQMLLAKITASGLDFLESDGGLGAILNVVTVRFEAETLRALLSEKIQAANIPQADKDTLLSKLQTFSSDILKAIIVKLIEKGIEKPEQLVKLVEMIWKI